MSADDVRIRPARIDDVDRLHEICLRTADDGGDATALHHDPLLVGHVWAAPYVHHEPGHAFVAVEHDDRPAGYVLAARDSRAFERVLEAEWWPPLRVRYPLDADWLSERDRMTVARIHEPPIAHEFLAEWYPSHLHIDLLPELQGRGVGRRLIDTVCTSLVDAGSPGVHLGVSAGNQRAIGFYRAVGFTELGHDDEGYGFGLRFAPDAGESA